MLTPDAFAYLQEDPQSPPRLFVVVDTEEEFDWDAPFSRESVGVTNIQEVVHLQRVLRQYGLRPTYISDYPVARTQSSAELLRSLAAAGECHIGAHLHPWVTPPFDEPLKPEMSFGCNLGASLERAKITALTQAVHEGLGVTPTIYKAGRYGFGLSTATILEDLGYTTDNSVIPHMDFRSFAGPSFEGFEPRPATFGTAVKLLELPCTTGFVGPARGMGEFLHRAASGPLLAPIRAVGILAKTGFLNRVMLSPEGNTFDEMTALTRVLHADGLRTFALTLHSSTLKPGCTSYVSTLSERSDFLATIDRYCDFFFSELHGEATTPLDLYRALVESAPVSH